METSLLSVIRSFLPYFFGIMVISVQAGELPFCAETLNKVDFPVIYRPEYNVSFGPLDYLHAFDGSKYGHVADKIAAYIKMPISDCCSGTKNKNVHRYSGHDWNRLFNYTFYKPEEVSYQDLRLIHTEQYLNSDLKDSSIVARIVEITALSWLPNSFLQSRILKPMRYATGGTILGAKLALRYGKAINLAGGYHHAKPTKGEGFCVYADIPIAIQVLWKENPNLKVMVIDLDAHQGNGVAESLKDELSSPNPRLALFDVYNSARYPGPWDGTRKYISYNHPASEGIGDQEYRCIVESCLPAALDAFKPGLIIYNAGTDIFAGDTVGGMNVSKDGIIARDQFVFEQAKSRSTPILMVLSGGYTQKSADIIADSIINLTSLYK